MRKVGILLLSLLLLLPAAMAAEDINIVSVNNSIFFFETAQFDLTIENQNPTTVVYSWSVNPVEWIMEGTTQGAVRAGDTETYRVAIKPNINNYRGPGRYDIPLSINTNTGTRLQKTISIFMKSGEQGLLEYQPSVTVTAAVADEVDPREDLIVEVKVRNRNIIDLENLSLIIEGDFPTEITYLDLNRLEEKTRNFRFPLDPQMEPGTYEVDLFVEYQNRTLSEVQDIYEVLPYSESVRDFTQQKGFFKKTQILEIRNSANIPRVIPASLNVKWWSYPFTRVDIQADEYEQRSKSNYVLSLKPDESAIITVRQNFIILPIIGLIVLIAFVTYLLIRPAIVLKKQIIVTGQDEEGVSEMKVRIYIRNRTERSFYNIRVIDKTPTIANVIPPSGLGVMEPTKVITTEKKGTIVKWDFESLEAFEERIVTYSIKSRLKIVGTLGLPPVRIKYENAKGVARTTESGRAFIGEKR